jgi:Tfp pilus assembly protein PilX
LLIVSAIGLGMIYTSNTETSINANYRDTQLAYYAMQAGLSEVQDRMRTNAPSAITLPTAMPSSANPGSIVYLTNPTGSESISPTTFTNNPYFDDEFCHESFTTLTGLTVPANTATPCGSGGAVPSGAVTTVASTAPFTGTASALSYKWVRITLKQNGTFPSALVAPVDASHPLAGQVCWDSANGKEIVANSLGYSSCAQAQNAGYTVGPIYILTSFAYTPQGTRRIGQTEVAAVDIVPPPAALAMAGPGASFPTAPNSNNLTINGNNTGAPAYNGPGTCSTTTPTQVAAVSTGDMTGQTTVAGNIPPVRDGNYTGTAPTAPTGAVPPPTPSVVDEGTDTGGSGQLSGLWSSPQQLNDLVTTIAGIADQTVTCGIGTPCTGTYGTDASPQITYVDGDLNLTGGAGLLVVTGTLTASGHPSFDGLILVIGQGIMSFSGGGNGQINGSIFIANTNSRTSPYAQLSTLGAPQMSWSGGGTNAIQFNSCWANWKNNLHYMTVSSREMMY